MNFLSHPGHSLAATIVAVSLLALFGLSVAADEDVPFSWNTSLFERPAKVRFVQRSPNVKEWQIDHNKGANGRSLGMLVQLGSAGKTELKPTDATLLFPILFKEALTEDADQAQASYGESASAALWDGQVSYAPARELAERTPTMGDIDPNLGVFSARAPRGPEWTECVMFSWSDEAKVSWAAGRYCHTSPANSTLMTTEESLSVLKELDLERED